MRYGYDLLGKPVGMAEELGSGLGNWKLGTWPECEE